MGNPGTLPVTEWHKAGTQHLRPGPRVYKQRWAGLGASSFLPCVEHHLRAQPLWESPRASTFPGLLSLDLTL